ncbi:N-acetyltransferase, partial [bacterium]
RGMEDVEMSWILESNRGMCNIIESLGGQLYKRYRIYQKNLD